MSAIETMALFVPHLLSTPLLPLTLLAVTVLSLATWAAADTTVQERQIQRHKEEIGESVALTKVHAVGFGIMASLGLLAMWMWSNVLGKDGYFFCDLPCPRWYLLRQEITEIHPLLVWSYNDSVRKSFHIRTGIICQHSAIAARDLVPRGPWTRPP